MKKQYSVAYLRGEIARIIAPWLPTRRPIEIEIYGWSYAPTLDCPPTDLEIDDFIGHCPLLSPDLSDVLFWEGDYSETVELDDEELSKFLRDVQECSEQDVWISADDWLILTDEGEPRSSRSVIWKKTEFSQEQLELPETRITIGTLSPSFRILEKLLESRTNLDSLHWREFEELIAELLEKDGYAVELGTGRNDGGKDIIATKDLGEMGMFKAVWQAKKKQINNKVGISVIRELADTRSEQKASKGIIVTTTYLTKGALERVMQDRCVLGKVDRVDLMRWIDRILQNSR